MDINIEKILNILVPHTVCFWTGAGISSDSPTCLPLGDALTKEEISYFCLSNTWDNIIQYFYKVKMKDSSGLLKTMPRSEIILDNIVNVLGINSLKIFKTFNDATPNLSHDFFAKHIKLGGYHVTANFDSCIEKCLKFESSELIHLHGIYDSNNLDKMGIVLSNIASGLPEILANKITSILMNKSFLIFIGYSGRDYFDINPYFVDLINKKNNLKNLSVLWVKHTEDKIDGELVQWQNQQEGLVILDSLSRCGAKIFYLTINTGKFLNNLEAIWGLQSEIKEKKIEYNFKKISNETFKNYFSINEHQRAILSAQIYSTIGIGKEVINLKDSLLNIEGDEKVKNKIYFLISNAYRDLGFYKKARKFSRLLSHSTSDELFIYYNRLAGDYWLSGNYLGALYHFVKGMIFIKFKFKRFLTNNKDFEILPFVYYELLDTFLHWFRDIKNLPLIGKLIPLKAGIKVFNEITENKEFVLKNPRTKAGLIQLYNEIPGFHENVFLPEYLKNININLLSDFQETDSVLGIINSMRYEIRLRIRTHNEIKFEELKYLYFCSQLIGDTTGILKVCIIIKRLFKYNSLFPKKELKIIEWVLLRKISWIFQWYYYCLRNFISFKIKVFKNIFKILN